MHISLVDIGRDPFNYLVIGLKRDFVAQMHKNALLRK